MSSSSDYSWSSSGTLWNFNDLFEQPESGPQDAPFYAVQMQTAPMSSSPSSNSCPSWLDPSLFDEGRGLHIPNDNIDINHFPHAVFLNGENPNALKDASAHLGSCGQVYTPNTTNRPATTTGFVNSNGTLHVPQYSTLSSPANTNQTNSALDTRSASLEGFRNGAGLLPSANVSSTQRIKLGSNGTNVPNIHNPIDPNTYSAVLYPNTVPQPPISSSAPHGPVVWQHNSSNAFPSFDQGSLAPPTLPMLNTTSPFGQGPIQTQPQFAIHPNALGGLYVPFAYTNSLANNAANWGVGNQHSNRTLQISPTGHAVSAVMPDTKGPSTSEEASSVELASRQSTSLPCVTSGLEQNSKPSPAFPSSHLPSQTNPSPGLSNLNSLVPIPSTNSEANSTSFPAEVNNSDCKSGPADKKGPKRKRGRQLFPSGHLWVKTGDGRYACQYNGPATSVQCTAIISTPRNLGRHMREVHALQEMKMDIPDHQRIAVNGMPDGLKMARIICPYSEDDLNKCRYYREEGRRWEIKTMNRGEKFLRQHILCYHREGLSDRKCKRQTSSTNAP